VNYQWRCGVSQFTGFRVEEYRLHEHNFMFNYRSRRSDRWALTEKVECRHFAHLQLSALKRKLLELLKLLTFITESIMYLQLSRQFKELHFWRCGVCGVTYRRGFPFAMGELKGKEARLQEVAKNQPLRRSGPKIRECNTHSDVLIDMPSYRLLKSLTRHYHCFPSSSWACS
jgi:hypothetical protein